MEKVYDVGIIGLGAMGSAAAYYSARAGLSVIGWEQFTPVHELGSSHGESRIIRQAYFEHPGYVPLTKIAYELWRDLERKDQTPLLTITGALMVGHERSEVLQGCLASAERHGLAYQLFDAAEIRRRYPMLQPDEAMRAFFEPDAGVLAVERCVESLQRQARGQGAELFFEKKADWRRTGGHFEVRAGGTAWPVRHLILSPGAWAGEILGLDKGLFVPERIVMAWFRPHGERTRFQTPHFPVHLWEPADGTIVYGMPFIDDAATGVKAAFHNVKTTCEPDSVSRVVQPAEVAQLRRYLERYIPDLPGTHMHSKICLYTASPDGHFLVGAHPFEERCWIAGGFSGHGFKFAPVFGRALADLVAHGNTGLSIEMFDPQRFL